MSKITLGRGQHCAREVRFDRPSSRRLMSYPSLKKTTEICRSKKVTCLQQRRRMVALQYRKFSGHVTIHSSVSFIQFHALFKWISLNFCTLTTSREICLHMATLRINVCTIITIRNALPQEGVCSRVPSLPPWSTNLPPQIVCNVLFRVIIESFFPGC